MSTGAERIHLDALSLAIALVEADDDAAARARARRGRPDDVRVDGIRRREPAFAAEDPVPLAARDLPARFAVARSAIRRTVLLVAVDEVRRAIVDRDVIDLRDRELLPQPGATPS